MTSRSDLEHLLPLDGTVPAKTFVLEVHAEDPDAYLREIAGDATVEPTEDVYLSFLKIDDDASFWVDRLNPRFWSFHTTMQSGRAGAWIHERVESRRDTDWMWLPSGHLRHVAPGASSRRIRSEFIGDRLLDPDEPAQDLKVHLTGAHAERLLDQIASISEYRSAVSFNSVEVILDNAELGVLREAVKRQGSFAALGDSFSYHAQFVRSVVARYEHLVKTIEDSGLRFDSIEGDVARDDDYVGATFAGHPISIEFSRQIRDLPHFCSELFNSRAPFRLWGRPAFHNEFAEVDAVDLHVGERLRVEVGHDWLRVYLQWDNCGNTVARLISNLQSHFDSALAVKNSRISAAVTLEQDMAKA
jgi:hypothetical protein